MKRGIIVGSGLLILSLPLLLLVVPERGSILPKRKAQKELPKIERAFQIVEPKLGKPLLVVYLPLKQLAAGDIEPLIEMCRRGDGDEVMYPVSSQGIFCGSMTFVRDSTKGWTLHKMSEHRQDRFHEMIKTALQFDEKPHLVCTLMGDEFLARKGSTQLINASDGKVADARDVLSALVPITKQFLVAMEDMRQQNERDRLKAGK